MTAEFSVCHVVNSVRDTSLEGELAAIQTDHEHIDRVGILGWFEIESFWRDETVDCHRLNVPDSAYHINGAQYRNAKRVLSEFDIVHTHHPHSGFYGKLVARRLGKPVVATDHNNHAGFSRKGRIANGLTNVFADRVVPVSESVEQSFSWWEELPIDSSIRTVITNGVNVNRLASATSLDWSVGDIADVDRDALLVGSAGMLSEQKAHHVLIEAVDRANGRTARPIELVISGDGPRRGKLRRQVAEADCSDRLHLLGFLERREQVYRMMDEIDIYAMPSKWEGLCVAALEAMAMDNACVFSDIPEFRKPFGDVAEFHRRGEPECLADALVALAGNRARREELAATARELVMEEYTLERTVDEYVELYMEILDDGPRRTVRNPD